ncbi:MAG: Mrp/NBP35 family ATP-binding protein [Lachnospiraceae bacterium]|nr:Mrp/NBP35 family ATP-binding protein [Lachnospiraceae bacterium]
MSEENINEAGAAASCDHDCSSCSASCGERVDLIPKDSLLPGSRVGRVIGVVSGKGGVGKSMITALSAISCARMGYSTAILDADITGPSIPKMFGITEKVFGTEEGLIPAESDSGIKLMSTNLILENEADPVAWRGPVLAGVVRQYWTDVVWGDVDVMFVDMPPGTGDVYLTVCQSLPVDSLIIVTSPQELVGMIVEKAVKMAEMMKTDILGIVENFSYLLCPGCGEKIELFGKSHAGETAEKYGLELLGRIPIMPELAAAADGGRLEGMDFAGHMDGLTAKIREVM